MDETHLSGKKIKGMLKPMLVKKLEKANIRNTGFLSKATESMSFIVL